ncbi:MAG: RsiV family protein [Bacteroidales bacterium]|nr:RsiV family protein [Bacteroidales bacterium]
MKKLFLLGVAAALAMLASCNPSKAPLKMEVRHFADTSAYARINMDVELPLAANKTSAAIRATLLDVMDHALSHVSNSGEERDFNRYDGDINDSDALFSYYEKKALEAITVASDRDCGERVLDIYASETLSDSEKDYYAKNISGWDHEYTLRKLEESDSYVVFDSQSYVSYGGAHGGIIGEGPVTFSKKDGHPVLGFFEPDSKEPMQKLLREGMQRYFQSRIDEVGLELDAFLSLPEDGLIPLPAWNPYPVADSLHFVYQQYEVAPYASGMPEFSLPLNKVRGYLIDDARKVIGR